MTPKKMWSANTIPGWHDVLHHLSYMDQRARTPSGRGAPTWALYSVFQPEQQVFDVGFKGQMKVMSDTLIGDGWVEWNVRAREGHGSYTGWLDLVWMASVFELLSCRKLCFIHALYSSWQIVSVEENFKTLGFIQQQYVQTNLCLNCVFECFTHNITNITFQPHSLDKLHLWLIKLLPVSHPGLLDQVVLVLHLFPFFLAWLSFFAFKPFFCIQCHSPNLRGHNIHHLSFCSTCSFIFLFLFDVTIPEDRLQKSVVSH